MVSALLVVNYRSSHEIERNIVPLARDLGDIDVVIVDSRSDDTERDAVRAVCESHGWVPILPTHNPGFGGGMNLAAAEALRRGADALLLVNPDARLGASAASALLSRAQSDPRTLAAPIITRPDGSLWSAGHDLYLDDGRMRSRRRRIAGARVQPWLSGAVLALSADLWRELDGFDEQFFLYWEDVDMSYRVRALGGRLEIVEEATAVHAEGGSQRIGAEHSGQAKSSLYYRYNVRNRLLFGARHLGSGDLRRWRRLTPRVSWEILLQGGRRQIVRSPRPLLAVLRGAAEGFRIVSAELRRRPANR